MYTASLVVYCVVIDSKKINKKKDANYLSYHEDIYRDYWKDIGT